MMGTLRVDQTMLFYDLEDVLTLALNSPSSGRRAVAGWRRGLHGNELGRLLSHPAIGVVQPKDIIKIKWTTGSEPCKGRSRIAATALACDAILCLMKDSRKSLKGKAPSRIHQWLVDRRNKAAPELYDEHEAKFKEPRGLPDSLACIDDTTADTWDLNEAELTAARPAE